MPSIPCTVALAAACGGDLAQSAFIPLMAAALLFVARPIPAQVTAPDPAVAVAEDLLRALANGRFEYVAERVAPAAAGQLDAPRLETIWRQLEAQVGGLSAVTPGRVETLDTLRRVQLAARFERAELTVRIVLTPGDELTGLWFGPPEPPEYVPPAYVDTTAFTEESITVGEAPWALPGALTLPAGSARVPAVVLVHGSGPHDRDETIGPNRPFRDLAWGLASRGIAVLRYDKRTYVHGARMGREVTVEQEVIDDAVAALRLAREHPRIDPARVFLLGHSLGAQLAPEIARRDDRVAGVTLLAAPARPPAELVLAQLEHLATLPMNAGPEAVARIREVRDAAERLAAGTASDTANILGAPASYWHDLARYDAVRTALALDVPLLVLQGGRDYQVTTEGDFRRWREALQGRPNAMLTEFPTLNHLFMPGQGTPSPEEYMRSGHVDAAVIEAITAWIGAR